MHIILRRITIVSKSSLFFYLKTCTFHPLCFSFFPQLINLKSNVLRFSLEYIPIALFELKSTKSSPTKNYCSKLLSKIRRTFLELSPSKLSFISKLSSKFEDKPSKYLVSLSFRACDQSNPLSVRWVGRMTVN